MPRVRTVQAGSYFWSGTYYIYTLTDPETQVVRYIGCTCDPHRREMAHRCSRQKHLAPWIAELRAKGLRPIFTVIDTAKGNHFGRDKEVRWIRHFERVSGKLLLNKSHAGNVFAYAETA